MADSETNKPEAGDALKVDPLALHLGVIEVSIARLRQIRASMPPDAQLAPEGFVATLIDSAIPLLMTAANSIDNGTRRQRYEFKDFLSLMVYVHRSYFNATHTIAEVILQHICKSLGVQVENERSKSVARAFDKIAAHVEKVPDLANSVKQVRSFLQPGPPQFMDYLHAVFEAVDLAEDRRPGWQSYMDGLSIVRNKASHADTSLTEGQRGVLKRGGLGELIDAQGELQFNTSHYPQFIDHLLRFLDELKRAHDNKVRAASR